MRMMCVQKPRPSAPVTPSIEQAKGPVEMWWTVAMSRETLLICQPSPSREPRKVLSKTAAIGECFADIRSLIGRADRQTALPQLDLRGLCNQLCCIIEHLLLHRGPPVGKLGLDASLPCQGS